MYRNVKLSTDVDESFMLDELEDEDEVEFSEESMEEVVISEEE